MSPRRPGGIEPEQRRRQAHANELMLAVAMRLLGEARAASAFPTGDDALASSFRGSRPCSKATSTSPRTGKSGSSCRAPTTRW